MDLEALTYKWQWVKYNKINTCEIQQGKENTIVIFFKKNLQGIVTYSSSIVRYDNDMINIILI